MMMKDKMKDAAPRPSVCTVSANGVLQTMKHFSCHANQAIRVAALAWERGAEQNELPLAKQRRFLEERDGRFDDGKTQFRVYRGCLFIFSPTGALVTVYPVPKNFSQKPHYIGKQRIRDFHLYKREKSMEGDLDYAV